MSGPHITLEQWRALLAVVDAGGYAQAAEALHKSQSAISYAVQQIESRLGVRAFEVQGRRAVLTATGQLLVRRARALVEEAEALERTASQVSAGWEAELRLAVEIVFPNQVLLPALAEFGTQSPHTRIELIESVIGGTSEALLSGRVDLAIAPVIPQGFIGEALMQLRFLPVAHPDHPLHALGRPLTARDLRPHRHLVVRDSGSARDPRDVSADAVQRWVVSTMATSIQAAAMGHGWSWFPEDKIRDELRRGLLRVLPLRDGGERWLPLYLVFADRDSAGPGLLALVDCLRRHGQRVCTEVRAAAGAGDTPPSPLPAATPSTPRPRKPAP